MCENPTWFTRIILALVAPTTAAAMIQIWKLYTKHFSTLVFVLFVFIFLIWIFPFLWTWVFEWVSLRQHFWCSAAPVSSLHHAQCEFWPVPDGVAAFHARCVSNYTQSKLLRTLCCFSLPGYEWLWKLSQLFLYFFRKVTDNDDVYQWILKWK